MGTYDVPTDIGMNCALPVLDMGAEGILLGSSQGDMRVSDLSGHLLQVLTHEGQPAAHPWHPSIFTESNTLAKPVIQALVCQPLSSIHVQTSVLFPGLYTEQHRLIYRRGGFWHLSSISYNLGSVAGDRQFPRIKS